MTPQRMHTCKLRSSSSFSTRCALLARGSDMEHLSSAVYISISATVSVPSSVSAPEQVARIQHTVQSYASCPEEEDSVFAGIRVSSSVCAPEQATRVAMQAWLARVPEQNTPLRC